MDRLIKFRGISIETGEWVFGDLIQTREDMLKDPISTWIKPRTIFELGTISMLIADFIKVKIETVGQFTGLLDASDVEIYKDDILNICYTSNSGEYIHDCIYTANKNLLGSLEFSFVRLFWENFGYNQIPISMTLCEKYDTLQTVYSSSKNRGMLAAIDQCDMNIKDNHRFPFNDEKESSFSSRYFKIIGNIHEHPSLLKKEK